MSGAVLDNVTPWKHNPYYIVSYINTTIYHVMFFFSHQLMQAKATIGKHKPSTGNDDIWKSVGGGCVQQRCSCGKCVTFKRHSRQLQRRKNNQQTLSACQLVSPVRMGLAPTNDFAPTGLRNPRQKCGMLFIEQADSRLPRAVKADVQLLTGVA